MTEVRLIYVDLDRTLLRIDLLRERLLFALFRRPLAFLRLGAALAHGGRVKLKDEAARHFAVDAANLPYNDELLNFLREKRAGGAELVLATGAPTIWANAVAGHLAIFDRVLSTSEENGNLKGRSKLTRILADAQGVDFAYAGDSLADRPVFEAALVPIVVGGPAALAGKRSASALCFATPLRPVGWWKSLRPHQWMKNILIFAPILAAHRPDLLWPRSFLAFVSFCLVASAVYLLNDFYDVDLDRQHPEKRRRAQASGTLGAASALGLSFFLLLIGGLLAVRLPPHFGVMVVCYGLINIFYSAWIKHIIVLDLLTIAFLYALRVFAGGMACRIHVSLWLFALIFFIALSLAHLKRYAELTQRLRHDLGREARPTYSVDDIPLIMNTGMIAGLVSVLVLALYVTAPQTVSLYRSPGLLFIVCLLLFYWIERAWFWASRERISGDPIVFIVTDPASYLVGFAAAAIAWVAAVY
jgi:4-hydroxybenzoate polyprenyltransferase/phosphoserine phosphatase